jgi:hypothetical protein
LFKQRFGSDGSHLNDGQNGHNTSLDFLTIVC